jgi:hypothetical protein
MVEVGGQGEADPTVPDEFGDGHVHQQHTLLITLSSLAPITR